MGEPRAKTIEEVRGEFIAQLRQIARYWATLEGVHTIQERCDGVIFSALNIFDGTSAGLPAMDIALSPHESDKEFCQNEGENWYERGMVINDCRLHDLYYQK